MNEMRKKELTTHILTWLTAVVIQLLSTTVLAAELPVLPIPSTASGQPTTATFYGGVTADGGDTYLPTYGPDELLDVLGEVRVEPGHVNSIGNIYVVVIIWDLIFLKGSDGGFYLFEDELIANVSGKPLAAVEPLSIIEGFPFGLLGLIDDEMYFFLAYDTQQNPGELYFGGTPIIVSITEQGGPDPFQLYVDNISEPIIQSSCVICHRQNGIAGNTKLVYATSNEPNYQQTNFDILSNYILNEPGGSELILSKPQGIAHGGGAQLNSNSDEYIALQEFVNAVLAGPGGGNDQALFDDVESIDSTTTLRKAALLFAGRLPNPEELVAVANGDETDLRQGIRDLMTGEGFTQFLLESANDRLLTQAFSTNLFRIVDRYRYPNSLQYYQAPNFVGSDRRLATEALAEEPLRLIAHVVTSEKPYTEVLTADYVMVNPYSAEIYGGNVVFDNPNNPDEWKQGEITEYYRCTVCSRNENANYNIPTVYPHAGILNSPAFLSRFPSTSTNRNRARARWAYYFFLGVDIEGLSERTQDPVALADENNPTLNNENCTVCHDIMDPVAGAFQNYGDDGFFRDQVGGLNSLPRSYRNDSSGLYQPGDTWYADMLDPGFNGSFAPSPDNSLQWLAQEFVTDSRFGFGTANFWYPAVIGREPLEEPENPEDADYELKIAAYTDELQLLTSIADDFVAGAHGNGTHNLKDLLVDLAMSNYFRAESSAVLDEDMLTQLEDVGIGRLLTPEQLNRKLIETTGFDWSYGSFVSLLDVYRVTYGGIDSFSIAERATELTTLMSTVVTAMANETSCAIVAQDFGKPQNQRRMFPYVELETLPTTNSAAIRTNIQYLHEQLLGEDLPSNDPEIDSTYALFSETWTARVDAGKGPSVSSLSEFCLFENAQNPVTQDPNQTLRSWAVVVNYLLRDYKFIHE
jgi:hypothetical protein